MYIMDKGAFEQITPEIAWVLGVIYSDGCVVCRKGKRGDTTYCLSFHQSKNDRDMLENIKTILKSNHPIIEGKDGYLRLNFSSKAIVNKLIALGCPPRKSLILKYPDYLNSNTEHHFIRGLFDGDGSISIGKQTKSSILGTKSICEGIKRAADMKEINSHIYKHGRDDTIFAFTITDKTSKKKFYDFIYNNSTSENRLNRKYDKYTGILSKISGKKLIYNRKLNEEQIIVIRKQFDAGKSMSDIQRTFKHVSYNVILCVCKRKTYIDY